MVENERSAVNLFNATRGSRIPYAHKLAELRLVRATGQYSTSSNTIQEAKSTGSFFQQCLQVGEGVMHCHCLTFSTSATHRLIQNARVFVVVAVQAEQLPVAAISRVIVVIVVFVMYRQLAQARSGKLASASPIYT